MSKLTLWTALHYIHISIPTALFIILALFFHAHYIVSITEPLTQIPRGRTVPSVYTRRIHDDQHPTHEQAPDLFIFRRTKKSGSSSMINALMKALIPLGYEPIPLKNFELEAGVRNEYRRAFPRRLLTIHHNKLTKFVHPDPRKVVIADSIRDGYQQITSYCRHMRHKEFCNESLIPCLQGKQARTQVQYRFAGNLTETQYSYIDLPLSSAHPALSTTVLRSVFPNTSLLLVDRYNEKNTACREEPTLREIYDANFKQLDQQIDMLRRRMLTIAGYPVDVAKDGTPQLDVKQLLDAAEEIEAEKYGGKRSQRKVGKYDKSKLIASLLASVSSWTRDDEGDKKIRLIRRRDDLHVDVEDLKKDSLW